MPLPFAPPPKDSSLYQQLESTTLQTLTADQLDTIRAKTFSQGTEGNEDEYRRLLLLGLASNALSISGPMPGTMVVKSVATTSSGTQVSAFTPGVGEVWQLVGSISTSASGISGTVFLEIKLRDTVNGVTNEFISTSTTTGTDAPMTETTQNPVFIDENINLQVEATGTFTQVNFAIPLIRVR
tara:strand:+ start:67 stop:615 length:549 start_codon:yes stop_codon:yes gene_type:complete